ncbi:Maf family protein [Flavisphingomonas formosensis]|uniref:Maf family protein n=1 Tax=Flavisphingomonas formosensis TaxID=861534 RepID=UPI0012F8893A|nr:nucleoside triphosphate pyrophosphatase [Sphingomonas formosensis]
MTLILASQSASRRAMLEAAGIAFEAMAPGVDEDAAKEALRAEGVDARSLADALAELKATKLSQRHPAALVLGADQTLALDDGTMLDKPASREDAAAHLRLLSGRTHRLLSAAVICEAGRPVWRHVGIAKLTVRSLSESFIAAYLDAEWPAVGGCVGCYRVEGRGVQLFARIEGDHFTIMGLPLVALCDFLRARGILAE